MAAQITKIDGTTVVHVAAEKPSDPLIYLIPGNPGLCEYYLDFVNELASLLPGHEIVAPSHRGYSLDSKPGELTLRSYNLDDQIRHKIELLEAVVTQQRKVIVLGHSVGAWIAQRVVTHFKNHTNVNIEFVGLLTPTVKDIAQSPRGLKVTKLGRYLSPGLLAGALRVLYYVMPGSFWQYLMNRLFRKSKNPDYARQVSLRYAQRPSMVYQTLSLATEEMATIGSDTEPHDIAGFWDSTRYTIWGFFAHDDHWVAPKTRQALFDAYGDKPNVHFEIVPDQTIPHAFCINRSREAADYVAAAIIKFEKQSLVESIEELKPLEVVPEVQTAEALAQKQSQAPREALGTSENVSEDSTLKLAPKLEEAPKLEGKMEGKLGPKPVKPEPKPVKPEPKPAAKPAATSAAASAAKSAAQSASKAHSPLERIATPTSQISKDSDGSKTPQSTASKESGRKSSMRRLGKALSRKKKQA